eukprot:1467269-Amphidinium_carterae.2
MSSAAALIFGTPDEFTFDKTLLRHFQTVTWYDFDHARGHDLETLESDLTHLTKQSLHSSCAYVRIPRHLRNACARSCADFAPIDQTMIPTCVKGNF